MSIPFMRGFPNGKVRVQEVERPPDVEAQAARFMRSGGFYCCEVLPTGEVNMSAVVMRYRGPSMPPAYDEVEEAKAPNGPGLGGAVDALVAASMKHLSQ